MSCCVYLQLCDHAVLFALLLQGDELQVELLRAREELERLSGAAKAAEAARQKLAEVRIGNR